VEFEVGKLYASPSWLFVVASYEDAIREYETALKHQPRKWIKDEPMITDITGVMSAIGLVVKRLGLSLRFMEPNEPFMVLKVKKDKQHDITVLQVLAGDTVGWTHSAPWLNIKELVSESG
jgi:hypothetical protein